MRRPTLVVLDVNETLSDPQLRGRFEEVGVSGELLEAWFAATLRDGSR
jgi:2-haloacid dehalogenase